MLILSLGTIVKTDATKAIVAFQQLANELFLDIRVLELMPQLGPLFINFNLGALSASDFKQTISDIFFAKAQNQDEDTKRKFLDRFEECWNAMCEVDDQAMVVLRYIANTSRENTANKITIYSDTNPLHFSHLARTMDDCGLARDTVHTTFKKQCSKKDLLETIVHGLVDSGSTETITVVLGMSDKITDPVLLAMTKKRDGEITALASAAGLKIEQLTESRVSVPYLESLMPIAPRHSRNKSLSLTPAFDAIKLESRGSPKLEVTQQQPQAEGVKKAYTPT